MAYTGSVGTMHSVLHTAGRKEHRVSFTTKDVSYHSVKCEISFYDLHVKHLYPERILLHQPHHELLQSHSQKKGTKAATGTVSFNKDLIIPFRY